MAASMHPAPQAATVAGARGAVTRLEDAPRYDLRGGRSEATFPAAPRGAPM